MGIVNAKKVHFNSIEEFISAIDNLHITKESFNIFFNWTRYHYLNGDAPLQAMITLECDNGKGVQVPMIKENPEYFCLDGIRTKSGKQFVGGIYTLDTLYSKAKMEQGDYFYNIQMFRCGSVVGTMSHDRNTFYLIYIKNQKPHNGDFEEMIDAVEKNAESRKINVAVMDFENDRLKEYFIKRGYEPFSMPYVDGVIKRYHA